MGLVLSDLTDEQKKELDVKSGVLVEDVGADGARQRAAGRRHHRDRQRGATTEAKSAAQVNDVLAKVEKGASVTLQMRRGEQQFFATVRALNGE